MKKMEDKRMNEWKKRLESEWNKLGRKAESDAFFSSALSLVIYRYLTGKQENLVDSDQSWDRTISKIKANEMTEHDYKRLFTYVDEAFEAYSSSDEERNQFSMQSFHLSNESNPSMIEEQNNWMILLNELFPIETTDEPVMGEAFIQLLQLFSESAGKYSMSNYTPIEINQLVAKIVTASFSDSDEPFTIYDPTMGTGSLLLAVQEEVSDKAPDTSIDSYGQEINSDTFHLANMNFMLHGVDKNHKMFKNGDSLEVDWLNNKDFTQEQSFKFDTVVANPPYSIRWDNDKEKREKDPRFEKYGIAPASKADYAFILEGLHHLDSKGTMAMILPHGVLFRGSIEAKIRQQLIENNLIDAVIGLPSNLFYNTSIPVTIIVLKGEEARKSTDIFFIDASDGYQKGKNQNKLRAEDSKKIVDAYKNRSEINKYAYKATIEEIKENDYNLNISRYVDKFEEVKTKPLPELAQDLTKMASGIHETTQTLIQLIDGLAIMTAEMRKESKKMEQLFSK